MVLTITVVGNGQGQTNGGHVLSPNELAQLMSGQTVTGLLNPDGTITLNSNVMSTQQLTSMPPSMQNGAPPTITSTAGPNNYQSNSISNMQAITSDSMTQGANNHSQTTTTSTSTQKKTGQKRLSAKQKLAQQLQQKQQQQPQQTQVQQQQQQPIQIQQQQQQQIQQMQSPDTRHLMTTQSDQPMNQQPQIVATVQLPNGQIGQLIAPSGGQFWSPNAINLQQLSMAVAAATGTMPQTMSIPSSSANQPGQQMNNSNMQQPMQNSGQLQQGIQQQSQQQQQQQDLQQRQQQQSSQSLNNQQQVLTTVQLPNSQMGQVMTRPGQSQIWSGGPISLSQLSALAQQGVVQLSPVQGIPTTGGGPNNQRVVEMLPQSAIQGLLSQNGQPVQTIPLSNGSQYITQDPNDPGKWQIVPTATTPSSSAPQIIASNTTGLQASSMSAATSTSTTTTTNANNTSGNSDSLATVSRCTGGSFGGQYINSSSQNTVLSDSSQSTQPQKKLKRLACTCPNCRDGDNNRNNTDKKKQHICHFPDCNKVYGKTSHLRAHLRWHSGERPYVCNWSFCGKKFTRSDELQRHRRTHTGEKRFQCSECLKRFMRSDHLSKHLKTHLSSKKSGTSQPQANGMPTIVTIAQDSVKMEDNMIDELALDSMDESNKQTNH